MDAKRWRQVRAVFEQALEEEGDRARFLKRACGENEELRREVESLLEAHSRTGHFDRVGEAYLDHLRAGDEHETGHRIGPYRLIEELGRGGMGVVYLAERAEGDFEQRVALKVVRAFAGPDALERFRRERQIAARLAHPNIARLLDGGLTEQGFPWFAMELVEGEPIDSFCDRQRLPVDERLRLFLQVCGAVAHAHRRLIVHRDLKPSNILIAADGTAKLLDFGIARPLESDNEVDGPLTQTGHLRFSLGYASPEQMRGDPPTVATDIYSLGVVLYELLAGRPPFEVANLSPIQQMLLVSESEPARPSTVVARKLPFDSGPSEAADGEALAWLRATEPGRWRRRLQGDLDTIVLKALANDPERRFGSVEALFDDLRRHLDGQPVRARGASAGYRVQKFARRHRVGVAASATVLIVLLAGLAGTLWQARRAIEQARMAEQERAAAENTAAFLVELFERADPGRSRGESITAREVLDGGAQRIETGLAEQPEIQARLLAVLGRVYLSLGLLPEAERFLAESLAHHRALYGGRDGRTAILQHRMAQLRYLQGDLEAGLDLSREAIATLRELGSEAGLADALNALGGALAERGLVEDARPALEEALTIRRRLLPPDDPDIATTLYWLAILRHSQGDYRRADEVFEQALEIFGHHPEELRPEAAAALENVGNVALYRRDYDRAEPLLREVLAIRERLYGEFHPDTAVALEGVAQLLLNRGRPQESEPLLRRALEINTALLGPDHPRTEGARKGLGLTLCSLGRYDEAEPLLRRALTGQRREYGDDRALVTSTLIDLGRCLVEAGKLTQATAALDEALGKSRLPTGDDHPYTAMALAGLGQAALADGNPAIAVKRLRQALEVAETLLRPDHRLVLVTQAQLADALAAGGELETAEPLYRSALAGLRAIEPEHPVLGAPLLGLAKLLATRGDVTHAAQLAQEAVEIRTKALPAGHPLLRKAEGLLATLD